VSDGGAKTKQAVMAKAKHAAVAGIKKPLVLKKGFFAFVTSVSRMRESFI
jgi:hypothetical protein